MSTDSRANLTTIVGGVVLVVYTAAGVYLLVKGTVTYLQLGAALAPVATAVGALMLKSGGTSS